MNPTVRNPWHRIPVMNILVGEKPSIRGWGMILGSNRHGEFRPKKAQALLWLVGT
jgi:hypothetical protein